MDFQSFFLLFFFTLTPCICLFRRPPGSGFVALNLIPFVLSKSGLRPAFTQSVRPSEGSFSSSFTSSGVGLAVQLFAPSPPSLDFRQIRETQFYFSLPVPTLSYALFTRHPCFEPEYFDDVFGRTALLRSGQAFVSYPLSGL